MHSPDWTSLPPDLLAKISEEFPIPHRARIRATCKAWHSAMEPVISPSPWLLLPSENFEQHNSTFLCLPDNYCFTYPRLPQLSGVRCVGSHAGWFVIVGRKRKVSLLNPLSGNQICLPSHVARWNVDRVNHQAFKPNRIGKMVFSANPTVHSYVVVAIYRFTDWELTYTKSGEDRWNLLETALTENDGSYKDIMHHDGKFYCITRKGEVIAFDLSGVSPVVTIIARSSALVSVIPAGNYCIHLACSNTGELFLVLKLAIDYVLPYDVNKSEDVIVLRLQYSEDQPCWDVVKDLGNMSLLVGNSNSISISAEDLRGMRGNCIYLTEFFPETYSAGMLIYRKARMFDMKKGRWECLYSSTNFLPNTRKFPVFFQPPFWFTPSLL
ncbi:F-box protein At3g56470-like [Musa acuminata AAA Group]|uniref:F-box protein At3g56470-like n=1 Tax=Musa acuminata AAA Group TaxID=214697 RepID=UPI0031D626F1